MSEVNGTNAKPQASLLIRGAIWIAIGALIAAALVCVVWVLIGDQNGIIGRAFLTILLLAGFAGIAILEAGLATRRPDWLALASMITWIVALIAGAIKIWLPEEPEEYTGGVGRFFMLLVIIGVLQLALLHVRLFVPAAQRYVTTFTRVIYYVTLAMLVLLVAMLVIYLTLPDTFRYGDLYWRFVVALAILTAVGTTLIPLLNALFAPKKQPAAFAPGGAPAAAAPWPTYADGATPLPVMPDGSPDWNAYYTGRPSMPAQSYPQQQSFPALPPQEHFATPAAPQAPLVSSPDAPIGADGLPVPPAGAPAAPDGIAGDWNPTAAEEAPAQTPEGAQSGGHAAVDPFAPSPEAPHVPAPPVVAPEGEAPVPPAPVPPAPASPAAQTPAAPEEAAEPPVPPRPEEPPTAPPAPGAFPPPPPAPRR